MSNLFRLVPKAPKADDAEARQGAAADLRTLADAVERGEVEDFVLMATEHDGEFKAYWWVRRFDAVALSAMLHDQALRNMRGDE